MLRTIPLCLCAVAFFGLTAWSQEAKDGVNLQVVKYAGLADVIHKNRGKVVLVDFWGDFCPPCKKGFPKVVDMHKKYAKNGLAVVSVSLDPLDDPEIRGRLLKFLAAKGASFVNLQLDEPPEFWQKKLGFVGPPGYFVFNRQGQWTRFVPPGDEEVNYPAIEKFIVERLQEK